MTPHEDGSMFMRLLSAGLYASSSFLIVVINKHVLTEYHFPSFQVLGIGQMLATILILGLLRCAGVISFPKLDRSIPRKVWPLPAIYVGNLVFGLGSTKQLSLPMMTVLRRFSILMTMAGEFFILGKRPSLAVQLSVYGMVFGAIIAASNDLSFDLYGYVFVLANDVFTAANGIVSKQKLEARDLGKNGLTYYNSLFMILPLTLVSLGGGDIQKAAAFQHWMEPGFLALFFSSCVMGTALMYTTVLCTHHNSALTTTVIGCLKNVVVTYYGMMFGTDYIFSWPNFFGLNVSIAA
ncbi:UDP-glucuronic acid/UDP-N-acetylgalactosamine transporter-like isoform X2 [Pollicipes pollicipes]|nr:UDP-glucuronic acid/UDP-N-acetylgalactosamine transporter-like isoform X2 [Pollicipes pollicipes]XP_037094778.1 UDP-glucuronic acid/UDP-N-acetylgalactosamine transporter-like isoform X2 [Pollicipes pollicipes]